MKGLLLKDWYMMKKYCRAYLLIAMVFTALALMDHGNLFFVFYPCLLCGMIPVNLLSYDERSHWLSYSATLPCTRAQIVSSKYLAGLVTQVAVILVTGITQGIKLSLTGSLAADDFAVLMLLLLTISTFSSSICLPFVFKLGVEKGRIAYYVMIGFVCGTSILASGLLTETTPVPIRPNLFLVILALVGMGIYALSWYLSIVFYKKREL